MRSPAPAAFILPALLIAAFALSAGCTSAPHGGNATQAVPVSSSPAFTPVPATTTLLPMGTATPLQTELWISITPVPPSAAGTLALTGSTNLPAGTPLAASIMTTNVHPTPFGYDFSHEEASAKGTVTQGPDGANSFSILVSTLRLNAGTYAIRVESADPGITAIARATAEILPAPATGRANYVDWASLARPPLSLPPLRTNTSISPFVQQAEWRVVAPGTGSAPTDLPYGSIIWCGTDAICRVFDAGGNEFLAVYDSNAEHQMQVPSGALIDSGTGNVTTVSLGGKVVLVKIQEYAGA